MEKNYKIILQYDGTRYDGWQKQGNTDQTIQGRLEAVLSKMAGKEVEVFGAGRTDAGVHALSQTANFHIDTAMQPGEILTYLNGYLPEDIAVLHIETAPKRFHSRLNAVGKTYLYRVETAEKKDVFDRKYIYGLGLSPDVKRMEQAAAKLVGEHDFRSFCSNKRMKKSSVRNLQEIRFAMDGSRLLIRYTGDGFLYHMVRILTGTLIEVGLGKRDPDEMDRILRAKDRQAAGYMAPPEGLFLESVRYEDGKPGGFHDKFFSKNLHKRLQ